MRISVKVTQDDIDRGTPSRCSDCPIARAIKRIVKPRPLVIPGDEEVGPEIVFDRLNGSVRGSVHPRDCDRVNWFIRFFDEDDTRRMCRPFSFLLNIPREVLR